MKSLRGYLLAFSAVLMGILCASAALVIWQVDRSGRQQAEQQLVDTARALSIAVDGELRRAIGILSVLQATDAFQQRDWKALDRQARQSLRDEDAWISVLDRTGQQLINTRVPIGQQLPKGPNPDWLWPLLDKGKPRVCNLTQGYIERDIVCVDIPVMENGRARYALSLFMKPRAFQHIVAGQNLHQGHIAALLDRRGTVIWRNVLPQRYVGKPAAPDLRETIARNASGTMVGTALDGKRMLAAFSRSSLSGWTFVVATPASQVRTGAFGAWSIGLLAAGLFALLSTILALVLAARFSRSVNKLTLAATNFHRGVHQDFEPSGLAEIDEAGRALDKAFADRRDSEERFRMAQDVGGIGRFDWDTVLDEGHVSDSYKAMHGLGNVPGPLRISQVVNAVHPDDRDKYLTGLELARSKAEPSEMEYRVIHGDGSVHWVSGKGRPMRDAQGQYVRALGIVIDVTRERESERALQELNKELENRIEQRTAELSESERRFRAIFDTSFQLTGLTTTAGDILLFNQSALDAVGFSQEQVVGLQIWEAPWWVATPDEALRVRRSVDRAAAGEFVRYTCELQLPAGRRVFDFSLKPLLDDRGHPMFLVAEGRDTTDLRQAEQALHQAQKMEAVGQLTGGIAHDFNNLLGAVVGAFELIGRRPDDVARVKRYAEAGLAAAERGAKLTGQLLAFSRAQKIELKPVPLKQVLTNMHDLLSSTIGPQIDLRLSVQEEVGVLSDATQLELAILNLAINARDAMPDGGELTIETRSIDLTDDAELAPGPYVVVCVRDTGTGMSAEVAGKAIDPFFTTKEVGKGTGLGLSQVYGIARQGGGTLRIETTLGHGTTVRLYLPRTEDTIDDQQPDKVHATADVTGATVLVIDDDKDLRGTLVQSLDSLAYKVIEAENGPAGLALLERETPDLIILDFAMPGMNGAEVAHEVRKKHPDLPIVFVSGYSDTLAIGALGPHAIWSLRKPFRIDDLQHTIVGALASA